MKHLKQTVVTAAIAILLSACGGGGSSTNSPIDTTPATQTTPVVTPADIQTSVPAFTYAADSPEFGFVSAFNQFRSQVGLGLLAQNPQLDKSAQNHLQYVVANDVFHGGTVDMRANDPATGRPMFHIESASKQYFTGVQELDRAKVAGYAGPFVGEEISFGGGKGGQVAFQSLASTVYHRAGLMFQGPRDIGVAAGQDRSQTFALEFGYVKAQKNASDFVGAYPSDNQSGVGVHAGVETPNPFPDLSTSNSDFPTKTGYPVSIVVQEGAKLEVLTFTITESGATAPLSARLMTADQDPNRYLGTNVAFLVANGALKANTVYTVAFSGRVNNVLTSKNWKFTTGN